MKNKHIKHVLLAAFSFVLLMLCSNATIAQKSNLKFVKTEKQVHKTKTKTATAQISFEKPVVIKEADLSHRKGKSTATKARDLNPLPQTTEPKPQLIYRRTNKRTKNEK